MLAYLLAIAVGLGSFALYMAAFFLPEIHRRYDLVWSGIGLFYALVLWVCAGRLTGGVLLGQVAAVSLLGWFVWQNWQMRRQLAPLAKRTTLPGQARNFGEVAQELSRQVRSAFQVETRRKGLPQVLSPVMTPPESTAFPPTAAVDQPVPTQESEKEVNPESAKWEETTSQTAQASEPAIASESPEPTVTEDEQRESQDATPPEEPPGKLPETISTTGEDETPASSPQAEAPVSPRRSQPASPQKQQTGIRKQTTSSQPAGPIALISNGWKMVEGLFGRGQPTPEQACETAPAESDSHTERQGEDKQSWIDADDLVPANQEAPASQPDAVPVTAEEPLVEPTPSESSLEPELSESSAEPGRIAAQELNLFGEAEQHWPDETEQNWPNESEPGGTDQSEQNWPNESEPGGTDQSEQNWPDDTETVLPLEGAETRQSDDTPPDALNGTGSATDTAGQSSESLPNRSSDLKRWTIPSSYSITDLGPVVWQARIVPPEDSSAANSEDSSDVPLPPKSPDRVEGVITPGNRPEGEDASIEAPPNSGEDEDWF
jgi:hypothetical protein